MFKKIIDKGNFFSICYFIIIYLNYLLLSFFIVVAAKVKKRFTTLFEEGNEHTGIQRV